MSKASMHFLELGRARSSTPMIDKCAIIPILACVYLTILGPLIDFDPGYTSSLQNTLEPHLHNRIFWPAMAGISVVLALRNYSRHRRLTFPPHIICLLAYAAFAGASVLWAFRPEISFTRYVQQVMILTSIVLPTMLAVRTTDLMRGLFLCFAFAAILNLFFTLDNPASVVAQQGGYEGYLAGKNALGEFAAVAFLLALHETHYPGLRRAVGIVAVVIATLVLFLSNCKTAMGLAFVAPFLATVTLMTRKRTGISPAILLLSITICYYLLSFVLSKLFSFSIIDHLSYRIYHDTTFSGRVFIWDFVNYEIARRPLLGWGYLSFWLVGPGGPSDEASGWIKLMPEAHNGYLDTMLQMGYAGFVLLVIFIIATLDAIGRVADRDPARGWLMLSLALCIILHNFLESFWMRGADIEWVVFVIIAAEIGRYWQPFHLAGHLRAPSASRP